MKLWKRILPVLVLALALPAVSSAMDLPTIVSADWLEKNGSDPASGSSTSGSPRSSRPDTYPTRSTSSTAPGP